MDTLPCAFCQLPYARTELRRNHELDICERCACGGAREALIVRGHTVDVCNWTTTEYNHHSKTETTIFHVSVSARAPVEFFVTASFTREGMLDKLVKLFQREIEVGDPLFDDFVFIRTGDREETEALLRHSGAQSTLMDLINVFDRVVFTDGSFELYERSTSPIGLDHDGALAVCALLVHIEHRHDPQS